MNIFYEESGRFKTAAVIQKSDSAYQASTQNGKRVKIKTGNVFLEFDTPIDSFLHHAESLATEIDIDLLWQVCGSGELCIEDIAKMYFGHPPSQSEQAAMLIALYAAPMYFYKKSKGMFKAAPQEILNQALAAVERKKQQQIQLENWVQSLQNKQMPAEITADLKTILHAPDKQALTYKAFSRAAELLNLSMAELAIRNGGIDSVVQYMYDGFTTRYFPNGIAFPDIPLPEQAALPQACVQAFSIDSNCTTEIDDALSISDVSGGIKRVGIHIAAPSLAVVRGSTIENIIMERLSTVYFPSGKITMLPDNWVAAFSLDAGGYRPAVSIYFDVDNDFNISPPIHKIEAVYVADNLRIQAIEPYFNTERGLNDTEPPMFNHHHHLIWLYQFAIACQKARGKYQPSPVKQYDYGIELDETGTVSVTRRERGSPIDTIVSEMMILANRTWAAMLDANHLPGLFRVQPANSKVRMSTHAEPHSGMGVQHYGWFTSPLRRAADYINQSQLISLINRNTKPLYQHNDNALFTALCSFDAAYNAYADFQRKMESYWSLVYIQQQGFKELTATLLREDLVRINGLPLTVRATGIPFDAPPKAQLLLAVVQVDTNKQFIALNYLKMLPTVEE